LGNLVALFKALLKIRLIFPPFCFRNKPPEVQPIVGPMIKVFSMIDGYPPKAGQPANRAFPEGDYVMGKVT
jgi:hypothetical protein